MRRYVCHGANTSYSGKESNEPPGLYYPRPHRSHEQSNCSDRKYCGLCILNRIVYSMVWPEPLRVVCIQPEQGKPFDALWLELLVDDVL